MAAHLPLRLPAVVYDDGLDLFLTQLALFSNPEDSAPRFFDFQEVRFYEPGALTALLAVLHALESRGVAVTPLNHQIAPAFTYLRRMDFFHHCGIDPMDTSPRRDATNRFVPLAAIDARSVGNVDRLAEQIAACIFPELADKDDPELTGPFDHVAYAVTELSNNVLQHARAPGFLMAQAYPRSDQVCVAIADYGIGIRGSFEENKPDFWAPEMSELDAVRLALKPRVSSKLHVASGWGQAVNAGVGLSILQELATVADGCFNLASGSGFHKSNHRDCHEFPSETLLPARFPGTVCAIQVSRAKLYNHFQLLHAAKQNLHLLGDSSAFEDLFEP